MIPRFSSPKALTVLTVYNYNGSIQEGPYYDLVYPRFVDSLTVYTDSKGHFDTENAHKYQRTLQMLPPGRLLTFYGLTDRIWRDESGQLYGGVPMHPDIDLAIDSRALSKATSLLLERVRGELDLAVDSIEVGQSVRMVRQALRGLSLTRGVMSSCRQVLLAASRLAKAGKRERVLKQALRKTGDMWLEYTYGWKPLASSIYGTFQEITRPSRPRRIRVRATERQDAQLREIRYFDCSAPVSAFVKNSGWAEIECRFVWSASFLETLSRFTSLNPLSIAWEVVPYSFVVDWVLDIGGYLRDTETALLSCQAFEGGYTSCSRKTQYSYAHKGTGLSATGSTRLLIDFAMELDEGAKDRKPLTMVPFPSLPRFKANLGWQRLVSAASLLSQQLTDREPKLVTEAYRDILGGYRPPSWPWASGLRAPKRRGNL